MVEAEQSKVTLGGVRLSFGGDKGHNQQVVSGVKGVRDAKFPDDAARSHRHPCNNDACGSCGSSAAGLCRGHRGRRCCCRLHVGSRLDGDFAVSANGVVLMEGKRRRLSNGCGKSAARIALALFAAAMASVLVECADAAGCMRRMERTRTGRSMVVRLQGGGQHDGAGQGHRRMCAEDVLAAAEMADDERGRGGQVEGQGEDGGGGEGLPLDTDSEEGAAVWARDGVGGGGRRRVGGDRRDVAARLAAAEAPAMRPVHEMASPNPALLPESSPPPAGGPPRGRDMTRSPAALRSDAPHGFESQAGGGGGLSPRSQLPVHWDEGHGDVLMDDFNLDESSVSSSECLIAPAG